MSSAKIDPLTGGLIFQSQDEEDNQVKDIQQKIATIQPSSYDLNAAFDPRPSQLSNEEKFKRIMSFTGECLVESELKELLATKQFFVGYDGFEPSGRMHIAQGILRAINVNKLVDAGCIFKFWVADWFALLNNKMGGDLDKIRTLGRYFIEVWKAAGMKMHNVQFLWASDEINKNPNDYWLRVMNIARDSTQSRIMRCQQIMGRKEGEDLKVAQMFYPCMQAADIFFLKCDVCSLGMDQRKVNMLAREYCNTDRSLTKPVILSHNMLSGLKEGQEKMSKSDPDSAIYMEDSEKDVNSKIKKAFCPEKVVEGNPILDYCKSIIFPSFNKLEILRKEEYGGNKIYNSYEELEQDFVSGECHPGDLKKATALAINALIEPVRQHFENNPEARQLLQQVKTFQVTR